MFQCARHPLCCFLPSLCKRVKQELATGLRIVFDKDTEAFVEELWAHLILEVLLAKQTSGA
jgi:hypothetical protein